MVQAHCLLPELHLERWLSWHACVPPRVRITSHLSSHPSPPQLPHHTVDAEVSAALEVQRLSADEPIAALAADPDTFFNRTRTVGAGAAPGEAPVFFWNAGGSPCAHSHGLSDGPTSLLPTL